MKRSANVFVVVSRTCTTSYFCDNLIVYVLFVQLDPDVSLQCEVCTVYVCEYLTVCYCVHLAMRVCTLCYCG